MTGSSQLFDGRLIAEIVERECGRRVRTVKPVVELDDRVVCEVSSDHGVVYFKASTTDPIALEAWAYASAKSRGVPVPDIYALDVSRQEFPAAYLIAGAVPGEVLAGVDANDPLYTGLVSRAADHLRALHDLALEGFGLVDLQHFQSTGIVRGVNATWSSALRQQVDGDLSGLTPDGILDAETADALRELAAVVGEELDPLVTSRQLHGDLGSEHVFVDRASATVTGFIDFTDFIIGDPAYELARFDVWHDDYERRRSILIEAYRPDDRLSEVLSRGRQLYTAVQFAANARFSYQRTGTPGTHNTQGLARVLASAL